MPGNAGSAVGILSLRRSANLPAERVRDGGQGMFLFQSPSVWFTAYRGELKNRTRHSTKGDALGEFTGYSAALV